MGILLFTKKGKTLAYKILGVWMFIIGLHLLAYHLPYLCYWEKYPHLFGTTALFPLLHTPMLFLYTNYSLHRKAKFRTKDIWHFSPALLSYIYLFRIFFFHSAEEKILLDNGEMEDTWFEPLENLSNQLIYLKLEAGFLVSLEMTEVFNAFFCLDLLPKLELTNFNRLIFLIL